MSLFFQLPQEVVDALVDYLHKTEGRQQTRVCSLIHRSFTYRAHYYLFSSIQFSSDTSRGGRIRSQRICHLNEILRRKPYIAEFVRDIHICLSPSDAEWITEDPDIFETMRLLIRSGCAPRKCVVEKKSYSWSPKILNPPVFMKGFVQEIVAPTVTSLEIRGVQRVPADLISSFANLNTLVVDDITFDGPALEIPPTSFPRILDLDLHGQLSIVPEISGFTDTQGTHGLDLTHLHRLKGFMQSRAMCRLLNGIFSLAARHLQSVSLSFNHGYINIMNISQLKRLRVLELHFRTHRGFHIQLSGVIHSLSLNIALEEVNVQVDLDVGRASWEQFMGPFDEWTELDASLCTISSRREFRYTCLITCPTTFNESRFEERRSRLADVMMGKLPIASATPKLSMHHDLLLNK